LSPTFYTVIGNRDYVKLSTGRACISDLIEPRPRHWLSSLVYLRKDGQLPEGHHILDCGAWSYKAEPSPRYTAAECLDAYLQVASPGDVLVAPDHMVLKGMTADEEQRRISITLANAAEFIKRCPADFQPMAATHGSTIETRLKMAEQFLEMGYSRIALGSVAIQASNRKYLSALIEETLRLRKRSAFRLHVLGVSALSWIKPYQELGVDSYDGSSMFFEAFTAASYYWREPDTAGIVKYSVKDASEIPLCECLACRTLRIDGHDTRKMGSNENNMGRAVHNINVYLAARVALLKSPTTRLQEALW